MDITVLVLHSRTIFCSGRHQPTLLSQQLLHHIRTYQHHPKMPGSSLWLVPPPSHPLHEILTALITTTLPALFPPPPPPSFAPHLTLTSNIDPSTYASSSSPQAWLDALPFPSGSGVSVVFERVKTEDVFFRRCYIKAGYDGVRGVVGVARAWGVEGEGRAGGDIGERTEKWLEEWRAAFGPHVSLG